MEKGKKDKIMYLTDVDVSELDKDIESTEKLMKGLKPTYVKLIEKILKENAQTRLFSAELFLTAIIHDLRLPVYVASGMLNKIANTIGNLPKFEESEEPHRGYLG